MVTTPTPEAGENPQINQTHYDTSLRADYGTQPDHQVVHYEYHPTGQLKKQSGARTSPASYTYDAQGRLQTLTTWQNYASQSGAATTTWHYHPQRGWLQSKTYPGSVAGPGYTYYPSGRLHTRTWALNT